MPDDHSELEPPLPIPNRTVKRYRADDSAETSVKVGYRQAIIYKAPDKAQGLFFYFLKKLKKVVMRGLTGYEGVEHNFISQLMINKTLYRRLWRSR